MYFPDRGCVHTLRTLYVYATGLGGCKCGPASVCAVSRLSSNDTATIRIIFPEHWTSADQQFTVQRLPSSCEL